MVHKFGHEELLPSGNTRFRWDSQGVHHSEIWHRSMTKTERKKRKLELELEYCTAQRGKRIPTYGEVWERDVLPDLAGLTDNTRKAYDSAWRALEPEFGKVKVTELIAADVKRYLAANRSQGKMKLVVLKKVSKAAAQLGYTPTDVLAVGVELPKDDKETREAKKKAKRDSILHDETPYLEAVKGSCIELAVLLMLAAGLRVGEALALELDDIDLDAGVVDVHESSGYNDGEFNGRTKTAESTGMRPIAPDYMGAVVELVGAARKRGERWVADNGFGLHVGVHHCDLMWRKLTAHLPHKQLRALRSTFATRALDAGVSMRSVNVAMGHTSLSTVLQDYDRPDVVEPLPKMFARNCHDSATEADIRS